MRARLLATVSVCLGGAWLAAVTVRPASGDDAGAGGPVEATVADLEWMVGSWAGDGFGGRIEEVFLPPSNGAMPVTFRAARGGVVGFYEFILCEQEGDGVVMRLHHFSPGMKRWEDEPVTLDLVELGETSALFAERDDAEERSRLSYVRKDRTLDVKLIEEHDGADKVTASFRFTLGGTLLADSP